MENKVGDNVPSDAQVEKLLVQLKDLLVQLKKFGVTVTPDERKRQLHARKGGEEHAERTFQLAKKYGIQVPGVPLEGMNNDLRLAKKMPPFVDAATAVLQILGDTGGQAESEYWQAFLAYYGVLSTIAQKNADLRVEYAATIDFMATGPRKAPPAK